MKSEDRGRRLKMIREKEYKTAELAVKAMNREGYKISKDQFYALQKGQWPTEDQVLMICAFFDVTPEYLLFGVDNGRLDKLSKGQRKITEDLIDHFIEENNNQRPKDTNRKPEQKTD